MTTTTTKRTRFSSFWVFKLALKASLGEVIAFNCREVTIGNYAQVIRTCQDVR